MFNIVVMVTRKGIFFNRDPENQIFFGCSETKPSRLEDRSSPWGGS